MHSHYKRLKSCKHFKTTICGNHAETNAVRSYIKCTYTMISKHKSIYIVTSKHILRLCMGDICKSNMSLKE